MKYELKDYIVSEIAKIYGVCGDTVRHYDRKGILKSRKSKENNYRLYSREDLLLMDSVMRLRRMEIHLEDIDKIINQYSLEETKQVLLKRETELSEEIQHLQSVQNILSSYRKNLDDFSENHEQMKVREMPAFICCDMDSTAKSIMDSFEEAGVKELPILTFNIPADKLFEENFVEALKDREVRAAVSNISYTAIDYHHVWKKIDLSAYPFKVIPPGNYLYYSELFDFHRGKKSIDKMVAYIREHNLHLKENLMIRMVATEEGNGLDSYEYWIPLE